MKQTIGKSLSRLAAGPQKKKAQGYKNKANDRDHSYRHYDVVKCVCIPLSQVPVCFCLVIQQPQYRLKHMVD